jgi:transposase
VKAGRPSNRQPDGLGKAVGEGGWEYGTDLWTIKRVRLLIEKRFGIKYSDVNVWRILGAMGFSSQKPEKRAIERNEEAVAHWKKRTWPALKKKPGAKAA